jgi:hypothetical protein
MVEQAPRDLAGEHPGVLKRMATMTFTKAASFQNLVAQLARRWRGQARPAGERNRLMVPSTERHEMGTRSRSRSPLADKVRDISYNDLVKLINRDKEVLIAFYDSEDVYFILEGMGLHVESVMAKCPETIRGIGFDEKE